MNPDLPQDPREKLETSLTALLLGELPHGEAAALHKKLAQDPELADLYERLKETMGVVRETMHSPAEKTPDTAAPLKLSDERRQKLFAHFKTVAPKEFSEPKRRRRVTVIEVAIAASVVGILSVVVLQKSEHGNVATQTDLATAKLAADSALVRAEIESAQNFLNGGPANNAQPNTSQSDNRFIFSGQIAPPSPPPASSAGKPPAAPIALPQAPQVASIGGGGGTGVQPMPGQSGNTTFLFDASADHGAGFDRKSQYAREGASQHAMDAFALLPPPQLSPVAKPATATIALPQSGQPPEIAAGSQIQWQTLDGSKEPALAFSESATPEGLAAAKTAPDINFGIGGFSGNNTWAAGTPNSRDKALGLLGPKEAPAAAGFKFGNLADRNGGEIAANKSLSFSNDGTITVDSADQMAGVKQGEYDAITKRMPQQSTPGSVQSGGNISAGDPNWIGELQKAAQKHDSNNQFITASSSPAGGIFLGNATGADAKKDESAATPPTGNQVPMLGDLPVMGSLFGPPGNAAKDASKATSGVGQQIARLGVEDFGVTSMTNSLALNQPPIPIRYAKAADISGALITATNFINSGIQDAKVRDAQSNVDSARAKLNIADMMASGDGPSALMTAETLRRLESLRIESTGQLIQQQTALDQMRKTLTERGPEGLAQAIPTGASDPLLSSLDEQLNLAEQRLIAVEKEYGQQHSEVLKIQKQEGDIRGKLTNRVNGIILGMEARVAATKKSLDELDKEMAKATSNDIATAAGTRPYFEAKADLEELKRFRQILDANKMAQKTPASGIATTSSPASEPQAPPKPATPPPIPQPEIQATENVFSTFSLNVSDVSFKLAAASLEKGQMPDAGSVRTEEFINAFDYRDPEPPAGVPVAFAWERAQYPFAQNRDLLRFSLKTAALGREPGKPLNIVLLLDNSGSMERADRVQIIHEALRVLATQLQPQDKFSIVTFARTPTLRVDGISGDQAGAAVEQVSGLTPEGGTNLGDAMNLAYETALRHYLAGGVNRVVLLTDGAANLGEVEPAALKQKVEANRKQGVALDCFGIGWEGYNDDLLEVLSRNGDGRYGFINTPEAAATEFAGQLAGALHVAASDVKVQVEFNPARVTAWRQIGYAKHQLTKEQFRDNTVNAAQIGAAESGNALYAIQVNPAGDGPLATVRVRYRLPGTSDYREHEWPVPYTGSAVPLKQASSAMRLAATASAFSEWLAASPFATEVSPDRLLGYLGGVPEQYGADARPKKLEWMIRQAKSLSGK